MSGVDTLAGKRALVTGASSGIGRATAEAFAERGADVAVAARREDRLDDLVADLEAEYGVAAVAVPTDVTDHEQVDAMVEAVVEEFGGLDVVVANAGIIYPGLDDLDVEEYHAMMDVNTDGMFFTTTAALPHLRDSEGSLVFVGSYAGTAPIGGAPVYSATKWWTRGFARSVAANAGGDGVAVSVVNPSTVRSEFGSEYREPNTEKFPPGEMTEAADVAEAIAFAAEQEQPNAVSELNLFRRDKYGG